MAGRRGSLRRLFDWHRAKGMWLWLGTFVLAVTGVTLTFDGASRDAARLLGPVSERLHETMPEVAPPAEPIGLDRAVAAAGPQRGEVHSIRPLPWAGVYAIRTFDPRDIDGQGRLWTYVGMSDGGIVGRRHDLGESAGDAFFAWQFALHSGRAAGLPGRILVALLGLLTALLCFSGLKLLYVRYAQGGARRPLRPEKAVREG